MKRYAFYHKPLALVLHILAFVSVFMSLASISLATPDTWTRKADMPVAMIDFSTSAVNGKIYIFGGYNSSGYLSTVYEYDPVTDTYTKKTDMPTARALPSTAVLNGKIYAIGGTQNWRGEALSTVEEYDPLIDKWAKKADMPTPRCAHAARAVDDKIYAIGGSTTWSKLFATVEEYVPATDTWTKKADMPTARNGFAAGVVNKKIYVIGGSKDWDTGWAGIAAVEEYDAVADKWTKMPDMPTPWAAMDGGVANGKIYLIGGMPDNKTIISTVKEYDPLTNTWTQKADIPTARVSYSASTVGGKIYVFGGANLSGNLATVEEYDTGFGDESGTRVEAKGKFAVTWGKIKR